MGTAQDLNARRFETKVFDGRGFALAYVREGTPAASGGVPLVLLHGYPDTKRLWWRVIEPLAAAGFDVIAPDLRGFGESDVAPDGFHDAPASSRDVAALLDHLGIERATFVGGDYGGVVIQDFALRFPERTERIVVFNTPLPFLPEMDGLRTLSTGAHDYFLRQGTDPDNLIAELATPDQRRRYIATFYSSRFWAHPGAFDDASIAFHTEPFADAAKLRACWGCYESVFNPDVRSEPTMFEKNEGVRALILFGPSDHVIGPDFDRMAALVFPNHVGPFLLRDCGHFLQWEAAATLVNSIESFCGDLLAAREEAAR